MVLVLLIFVLLIGVVFHNKYRANQTGKNLDRQKAIEDVLQWSNITINTKHQYRGGVHTFLGTFETPTPCYSHNVEVLDKNGFKEIAITYQEIHDATGEAVVCIEVIDERQFKVSFEGPLEDNTITTLNGELVNLNVFEVGEDENIEDVEIYIKG